MAQFLLSVWHDEDFEVDFSSDDAQRRVAQVGGFNADLESASALHFAGGLHPAKTAKVLQFADGAVTTTEGTCSESATVMGGFWIIEAADLDAALDWGRRGAAACEGSVEVRALQGE